LSGVFRHFPVLMITLPIAGAALMPFVSYLRREAVPWVSALFLAVSGVLGLLLVGRIPPDGCVGYQLGGWEPPFGIELKVDFAGYFLMMVVCGISLLALLYSRPYIAREVRGGRITAYYVLFLLLSASMMGFVVTGDIFNLFVFMEILALSSYALVAVTGNRNAVRAAFKYLLMGAPSSIMVLLGIGFLYSVTGTLNMADLAARVVETGYREVLIASFAVLVLAFMVKAAIFPLHLWLPDAHSIAPSPMSAMLSGLVVAVSAFAIARIAFSVFTVHASGLTGTTMDALAAAGAAAVLFGGIMAIYQRDFKMMIAYSTISHMGYVVLGFTALNPEGLTGAVYHVLDHGIAKACLFLCAGNFIYRKGYRRINQLRGAWREMPWTCFAFALAAWSVIGLPPSAGFISKWYLVYGNVKAGRVPYAVILLIGAILAAVYCFRIIYYMFFQSGEEGAWRDQVMDVPVGMLAPTWILSLATLFFGVFSYFFLDSLLKATAGLLS